MNCAFHNSELNASLRLARNINFGFDKKKKTKPFRFLLEMIISERLFKEISDWYHFDSTASEFVSHTCTKYPHSLSLVNMENVKFHEQLIRILICLNKVFIKHRSDFVVNFQTNFGLFLTILATWRSEELWTSGELLWISCECKREREWKQKHSLALLVHQKNSSIHLQWPLNVASTK